MRCVFPWICIRIVSVISSPLAQTLSQLLSEGARAIGIVLCYELEVVVFRRAAVLSWLMILSVDDRRIIAEDVHLDPGLRSSCDPAVRKGSRNPTRD